MTKKQLEIYKRYQDSNDYCLDHVYGRYSREKERAWDVLQEIGALLKVEEDKEA